MTAPEAKQVHSPNCGPRRDGLRPELIVLHYTAMHSAGAACARLCDPDAEVSAHYLIARTGEITQLVAEQDRAWHAGAGEWCGQQDINSRSIGIELDNTGAQPFSDRLMCSLEALLRDIMARWDIPAIGVIGHSDMAPGRKVDPGPRFDWGRLARQGLVRSSGGAELPENADPERFRAQVARLGYTAPVDDTTLLGAVRLRFRPFASGPLAQADFAALPVSM